MPPKLPIVGVAAKVEDIGQYQRDMLTFQSATLASVQAIQQMQAASMQMQAAAQQYVAGQQAMAKAEQEAAASRAQMVAQQQKQIQTMQKTGTVMALAGGGLTALGISLANTAGRYQELNIAMTVTGQAMGYTAEQLEFYQKRLEETGISMAGSRELILKLMQSNIDLADSTKLARAAQDLAVVGMKDSTTTANDLAYAISSLNVRILRKYGIVGRLSTIMKDYGVTLGLSGDALKDFAKNADDATRKQAMLQYVLAEAGKFQGVYTAAMGSGSKQIRSFSRYIADLKVEMGEGLMPVYTQVIFAAKDIIKSFSDLSSGTKALIARMVLVTGVALTVGGAIMKLSATFLQMRASAAIAQAAGMGFTTMLSPMMIAVVGVTAVIALLTFAYLENAAEAARLEEKTQHLMASLDILADKETYHAAMLRLEADRLAEVTGMTMDRAKAEGILAALSRGWIRGSVEYRNALRSQAEAVIALDEAVQELTIHEKQQVGEIVKLWKSRVDTAKALEDETDALERQEEAFRKIEHSITGTWRAGVDVTEMWRHGRVAAYEYSAAIERLQANFEQAFYGTIVAIHDMQAGIEQFYRNVGEGMSVTAAQAYNLIGPLHAVAATIAEMGPAFPLDQAAVFFQEIVMMIAAITQSNLPEILKAQMVGMLEGLKMDTAAALDLSAEGIASVQATQEAAISGITQTASAGVAQVDRVAERMKQIEIEREISARRAALDQRYWYEDQYQWIGDNEAGLTEAMQEEFRKRTDAVRDEADKIKETNASLAKEILSAEAWYQKERARIAKIKNEEEREAALAILEREYAERIERAKETAALEEEIYQEKLDREIEAMRIAGAAGGKALADAVIENLVPALERIGELVGKPDHWQDMEETGGAALEEIEKGADKGYDHLQLMKQAAEELKTALENIEGTYDVDVKITLPDLPPEVAIQSPHVALEYALQNLKRWAEQNPIIIPIEVAGADLPGDPFAGGPLVPTMPEDALQFAKELNSIFASMVQYGLDPVNEAIAEMEAAFAHSEGTIFDVGDALASFGSKAGKMWVDETKDAVSDIDAAIEMTKLAIAAGPQGFYEQTAMRSQLNALERERNAILAEQYRREEKLAQLEEQRQRLGFIQDQIQMMRTLAEYGIDVGDVFGDIEFGDPDLPLEEIVDATSAALALLVQAAQDNFDELSGGLTAQDEYNELLRQRVEMEEELLELQKQQSQLDFLSQQMKLLEMVAELGLAEDILEGLELGLGADPAAIMAAMSEIIQAMIEQAQEDLGSGSPARAFVPLGEGVGQGLAEGILRSMAVPMAATARTISGMMAAPRAMVSAPSVNRTSNITVGPNYISSGMDEAVLDARIRRVVREDM